jgi:glutathione gamma-glutamylcysteinyltransferase
VPDPAIAFSSHKGKLLFAESLASGHLDSFFELSEQFRTQSEPSLCGASSLTMVLNALGIDPNKVWKGPWRIFSEEMLKCSKIKNSFGDSSRGITMARLACLARCNGAVSKHIHASNQLDCDGSLAALRRDVLEATRLNSTEFKCHLIASYSRSVLGQTGDGHFSPIGGYHPESDSVLLLDVARFKYPPHWIRLQDLHRAMLEIDPDTGKSRGWISLSSQHNIRPLFFLLLNQQNDWSGLAQFLQEEMTSVVSCSLCDSDDEKMMSKKQVIENNRQEFVGAFSAQISSKFILGISSYVKEYGVNYITPDYEDSVMQLLSELRSTAMFTLVQK